ncbi:MAG TPA: ABC transporter substrate-binding protein [Clostridia bacterium]|nr:ABC transporter substrate-binding protein [Clostridia bacterium]
MKNSLSKIIALALCLMMVFGVAVACTPKPTEPTPAPATNAPEETPKEVLPDVPADRYDATVTPRTGANATVPLVLSNDNFDGKFNPFFSTSGPDNDALSMVELTLVDVDKTGAPVAGIDRPCFAYDFSQEIAADNSTTTTKIILKNGITFSDGVPFTVKDVLFSIYTYCDPLYDGASTFYTLDVQGLSEYRLQTSAEVVAEVDAILAAGFTLDESGQIVPNAASGVTADKQAAFWATLPATGARFTQEIIDYVVASYGNDEEAAGLDESFTWATFDTPSKQAAYAMAMWNLGTLTKDLQFTDASDKVWDLNTQELTAADCFNAIITAYGFDIEAAQAEAAGGTVLKDAVVSAYVDAYGKAEGGVPSISGITSGTMTCDDGVDREYIQVVSNGVDPTAIFKFNMFIAPFHYYTEGYTGELNEFGVALADPAFIQVLKDKNDAPLGAGPYIFQEYKDNVITYTANDSFMLGSPKIQTLRYQAIEMGAELDAVLTGTVHYTAPNASTTIINDITAAQGDYAKLGYTLVDNDGYGYIGINAQFFPEWQVRKAIAHAMNVQLTVDDWYGELATVNYRTMTKIQWAYPENPENLFPYDGTGETSKALFLDAGYIYDEAKNIMYYPEGHEKAGQQVTIKATIPGAVDKHPAGVVLIDTQKVLASIGVKLDIETDTALLNKLNTAYEAGIQMWAAAWGNGGADPDMFQVWNSDPNRNQSTSPTAKGLYWLYDNGSDDQKAMLRELNDLIDAGRSTLDVEERKVIYAQALELSTGTATEIPTYQRKNMFVYDKNVINADTLFSGEDVTPFQAPILFIWNVELNG